MVAGIIEKIERMMVYPHLFQPVSIGSMTLKNRLVMAPMESHLGNADGSVSPEMIAYYRERALGGTGLIAVEFTCVDGLDVPTVRIGDAVQDLQRIIVQPEAIAC